MLEESVNLRLTAEMRQHLRRQAAAEDRSEGYIIRKALHHYLAGAA